MKWYPTKALRFVDRDTGSYSGNDRILQQMWIAYPWGEDKPRRQWRDVPVEKEK